VRRGSWLVAVAALLVWALVGYYVTKPTDFHDYRKGAVQAAQSVYYSVRAAERTVQAQLDGRTFDTYVRSALDDAVKATAGAAKQFAGEAPVDAATTRMRDQLGPLLLTAARTLGDVQMAEQSGDEAALRRSMQALRPVGDRLSDFIESYQ
jgi:hypothetical protein